MSLCHVMHHVLRLYVPTMLVIGLHGWILPPGAILVCDLFVYSEFLIHPVLLLGASGKMRREIVRGFMAHVTVRSIAILFYLEFMSLGLFHLDLTATWFDNSLQLTF